ncbi:uncharacterized protein [Typha latifolia]|uniref:uncharacterized protein isoform X2 n=1 Tax=Typha latifolia TaxID=4733 RepID=UPI003C2C7F7C
MASFSSSFCAPRFPSHASQRHADGIFLPLPLLASFRNRSPLKASRKFSYPQDAVVVVPDPRAWVRDFGGEVDDDDEDDDEDEEEEDDRSLDLLVRFLNNVFGRISRRARKAARSVLPPSISTKLVRFSVNGVLILAFLWILKAFLEESVRTIYCQNLLLLTVTCCLHTWKHGLSKHSARPWNMVWCILHER